MDKKEFVVIKLSKPYIPEDCISNVVEVLRSGNLVQGEYVKKFENEVQAYLNVKHAVLVANGTAALHLSLVSLGIGSGDEVIVPAFTFPATANVVELVGAKSILVDINLDDFCINTSLLEKAITPNTKAIIPVHEFGQSAQMSEIMRIAAKYNLKVVEDAACALGTEYKRQKVGTFGDTGCFSLHPRKAVTSGEGGIIVTNDDDIARSLRILRNHGIEYKDGKNDFVAAGFNYRLTDFQAALCLPQLMEIEKIIDHRMQQANVYNQILKDHVKIPSIFEDRRMVYQTYHILVSETTNRDELIRNLKEKDIEANFGAQALNTLTYYQKKYSYKKEDFPNAVIANEKGLALPLGMHVSHVDLNYVISSLIA